MDSDLQCVLQPQSDCDKEQGGHIFQELHREQVKLISQVHGGIFKGIGSHFMDDPIAAAVPYHTCIIIRVSHESPIQFEFQGHRSLLESSNHKVQQYYPTKCFLERCFGGEHCRALSAHPEPCRAGCREEGRIFQSNTSSYCQAAKLQYAPSHGDRMWFSSTWRTPRVPWPSSLIPPHNSEES